MTPAQPGPRSTEIAGVDWHVTPHDEVLERLGTSAEGLSTDEARARRERFGPNRLRRVEPVPAWPEP